LQDIELSANSQRVLELPTGAMVTFMMRGRPRR